MESFIWGRRLPRLYCVYLSVHVLLVNDHHMQLCHRRCLVHAEHRHRWRDDFKHAVCTGKAGVSS